MAERYTLDTSALIAYLADEPGADQVERLLAGAGRQRVALFASFMTFMEATYRVWQARGERAGKLAYLRLRSLPLVRIDVSEGLILRAARVKASYRLSVADAWIAATALLTDSSLVHKDPEFRALADQVRLLELPMKPKRNGPRTSRRS